MSTERLLADLKARGIRLEAHGDRLRYYPCWLVTHDIIDRLKAAKAELLALLRAADAEQSEWHPAWLDLEWIEQVGPDGGRTLIHPDHVDDQWEELDELEPCDKCGRWERWKTLAGTWKCLRCDPLTTARRVMEEAARIQERELRN
jgi:hypothetical protein